jgi:hypothetical protein
VAGQVSAHTRKRLWTKAGDSCAFTGCDQPLLQPNDDDTEDTVVGQECHIVARRDHPSVARSPSLLSDEEQVRWKALIERRHDEVNLVLMCATHARLIDDPKQKFSVEDIVEMKDAHEKEVRRSRGASVLGGTRDGSTVVRQALLLEDIPAWQRKAVSALSRVDPDALTWLREQIGSPAHPKKVDRLITYWPERLLHGPRELAILLVREAEALAMWDSAARATERIAAGTTGADRADLLARAAADARVGGETGRREQLLREAEIIDPDSVRVRLGRLDDNWDGADQLSYLENLSTDDDGLASLIESQRALAYIRISDIDRATEAINKAQKLGPDSFAVRIARINLALQRARVAVANDRAFVIGNVQDAHDEALNLRDTLIDMERWEESVRLLMMASDARSLMRDLDGAVAVLEQARPEEVKTAEGAAVLGDAALRAGAPALALRFVEGATPEDGVLRIAASARCEIGGSERTKALIELENMALGDGPEAQAAAVARLILCMSPVWADWNEDIAKTLDGTELERYATSMRILRMVPGEQEHALQLAAELPSEAWAAEIRLRVAGAAKDAKKTAAAAKEFLAHSPDGAGRLLAAKGLAQSGEIERAGETAAAVARDVNCPPAIRTDAFHVAMKTLADRDEWERAERTWEEWRDFTLKELRVVDGRVSAWQVRVIHNRPGPEVVFKDEKEHSSRER